MSDALAPPIVLIDNFDSFTYNLYQLLCMRVSGRQNPVAVIRNDQTDLKNLVKLKPVSIVISPGPGGPKDTGISRTVIEHFCGKIPILGVCLGHQLIADVFGWIISPAKAVLHGKTSKITNNGRGLFSGLPRQFSVARYHSLAAVNDHKSKVLEVDATSDDGEVMALSHKTFPIWGIQFHPESFMSEFGAEIIDNFLSKQ